MDWFRDMTWLWMEWLFAVIATFGFGLLMGWFLWRRPLERERAARQADLATARQDHERLADEAEEWQHQTTESQAKLTSQAATHGRIISSYEQRIDSFDEELTHRDSQIRELDGLLRSRRELIARLEDHMSTKDDRIRALERSLENQQGPATPTIIDIRDPASGSSPTASVTAETPPEDLPQPKDRSGRSTHHRNGSDR